MKQRPKKLKYRKTVTYMYFIFGALLITLLQFWLLRSFYTEKVFKLPDDLFASQKDYPISELTLNIESDKTEAGGLPEESINSADQEMQDASNNEEGQDIETNNSSSIESLDLNEIQKKIVLKILDLLDEDIIYGYETFPETGYPTNNVWISTDVISVTLNESGYDIMELINKDMTIHKEDYPMDIKGRKTAIKYIDFRDVFFQEQFFKRNALELPLEFDPSNEDNRILWQPGDIVYFQFDPDNPYKDLGGLISSHKNADGVPLVIMISGEFGKVSEVDKLLEYKVVGHFRYPPPDVE